MLLHAHSKLSCDNGDPVEPIVCNDDKSYVSLIDGFRFNLFNASTCFADMPKKNVMFLINHI